jgi:hypothetical protein
MRAAVLAVYCCQCHGLHRCCCGCTLACDCRVNTPHAKGSSYLLHMLIAPAMLSCVAPAARGLVEGLGLLPCSGPCCCVCTLAPDGCLPWTN